MSSRVYSIYSLLHVYLCVYIYIHEYIYICVCRWLYSIYSLFIDARQYRPTQARISKANQRSLLVIRSFRVLRSNVFSSRPPWRLEHEAIASIVWPTVLISNSSNIKGYRVIPDDIYLISFPLG